MTEPLYTRLYDLLNRFIETFETVSTRLIEPKADSIPSDEVFDLEGVLVELLCEALDSELALIGKASNSNILIDNIYIASPNNHYAHIKSDGIFPFTKVISTAISSKKYLSWDKDGSNIESHEKEVMDRRGIYTYFVCPFYEVTDQKVLVICNRRSRPGDFDYYNSYEGSLCKTILELTSFTKIATNYQTAKNSGSRTFLAAITKKTILAMESLFPGIPANDMMIADYLEARLSLFLAPTNRPNYESEVAAKDISVEAQTWLQKWVSLADPQKLMYPLTTMALLKTFYALKIREPYIDYQSYIDEIDTFLDNNR